MTVPGLEPYSKEHCVWGTMVRQPRPLASQACPSTITSALIMKSKAIHGLAGLVCCISFATLAIAQEKQDVKAESKVAEIRETTGTRFISGVYPHLTTYAQSRVDGLFNRADSSECGIGANVPWAGKLWMVTYAPHKPLGSEHKLYSIDPDTLRMTIHQESVGGTPAGRMIHVESKQLFIGHHVISETGRVRTIQPKDMPGRVTAWVRHLSDPVNKVYMYDMEGMLSQSPDPVLWSADVLVR